MYVYSGGSRISRTGGWGWWDADPEFGAKTYFLTRFLPQTAEMGQRGGMPPYGLPWIC